ncbi:APC family permease [Erythrobacter sp. EC-HK427]|uniref:APC family permease n=1 Tax=Erythrobacter sp. EC-HK427 TaxID=2038396 RepID=UPI0012527688|nr:APC family permease [Erythrobacter sp. EC-HK427]VVT20101.1 Cationic amino acid transporter [Erythrobacter sp. EC-HK427]
MDKLVAPQRTVGFWGTALFPVNGMIGAGIFALPAVLAAGVGSFAPWLMLAGGIAFMPLALCYAWLARRFDNSGGPVLYGEAAFGRFVGFQAGWARYASAIVTAAANTSVMVAYLAALFPILSDPVVEMGAIATILAIITYVNYIGMRRAVGMLGVMTVIKVLPLVLLVFSALFAGNPGIGFAIPEFSDVETVVLLTFYAFMGFEAVTEPAGEMKEPRRDIPLAIVTMVAAVTALYMAVIWAYLAIAPDVPNEDNALAGAALETMGDIGAIAIVVAAAVSIAANNFNGSTTQPRLVYGMAQRGMLPKWFLGVSEKYGTPGNAILFTGVASILFGMWEDFTVLAVAGTLIRLVTYIISAAALPILEWRENERSPIHAVVAALAIALCVFVAWPFFPQSIENIQQMQNTGEFIADPVLIFLAIIALGTVLYFLAAQKEPAT